MVVATLVQTFYPSTRDVRRRRRIQARSLLISCSSDLDIIGEWIFFFDCIGDDEVSSHLKTSLLIFCFVGLITYIAVASDGRLVSPLLRGCNVPFFSTADLMILTVLLEDIPQMILSLLIENVRDGGGLSRVAMVNVITAGYDIMIKLSEAFDERNDVHHTGAYLSKYSGHDGPVSCVLAIEDPFGGRRGRVGSDDNNNRGGGGGNERMKQKFRRSFSGNVCKRLITGSYDNTCKLWESGKHSLRRLGYEPIDGKCLRTYIGHTDSVNCIASLDQTKIGMGCGDVFVSGSSDKTIKSWNVESGRCLYTFIGHVGEVTSVACIDYSTFVSGSVDQTLKLWSLETGSCLRTFIGHTNWVTCVKVVSMANNEFRLDKNNIKGGNNENENDDGGGGGYDDISDKSSSMDQKNHKEEEEEKQQQHQQQTPAHPMFLSGSSDKTAKLWSVSTARAIRTYRAHNKSILTLSTMDESTFVTGSSDGTLRLWNIETGICTQNFSGHNGQVLSVDAIDTETFVSGGGDGTARVWDASTGECLRTFEATKTTTTTTSGSGAGGGGSGTWSVLAVTSLDENTFVTGSWDHAARQWAIKSPERFYAHVEEPLKHHCGCSEEFMA